MVFLSSYFAHDAWSQEPKANAYLFNLGVIDHDTLPWIMRKLVVKDTWNRSLNI